MDVVVIEVGGAEVDIEAEVEVEVEDAGGVGAGGMGGMMKTTIMNHDLRKVNIDSESDIMILMRLATRRTSLSTTIFKDSNYGY